MRNQHFLYWIITGALFGAGLLSLLSIGWALLVVGAGLIIYGFARRWGSGFWATLIGFGVLPACLLMLDIVTAAPPCSQKPLIIPPHGASVSCSSIPISYPILAVCFGIVALSGILWLLFGRFRTQ